MLWGSHLTGQPDISWNPLPSPLQFPHPLLLRMSCSKFLLSCSPPKHTQTAACQGFPLCFLWTSQMSRSDRWGLPSFLSASCAGFLWRGALSCGAPHCMQLPPWTSRPRHPSGRSYGGSFLMNKAPTSLWRKASTCLFDESVTYEARAGFGQVFASPSQSPFLHLENGLIPTSEGC